MKNTENRIQKTEEIIKPSSTQINTAKPAATNPKYGTGISESDIDRIMKEFENR